MKLTYTLLFPVLSIAVLFLEIIFFNFSFFYFFALGKAFPISAAEGVGSEMLT